jgi:hypothetical protein
MFFGSGKPLIVTHTARDPIAIKFGITSITPEIIAYGACQVSALLSMWQYFDSDLAFSGSIQPQCRIGMADARYDVQSSTVLLQCSVPFRRASRRVGDRNIGPLEQVHRTQFCPLHVLLTVHNMRRHFFPQGRSCNARKQRAIPPTSSNSDVSKLRDARARQRQLALSQATS